MDAGFSRRETEARLSTRGEPADGFDGFVISHEHTDHISGLRSLARHSKAPIYITRATREAVAWDPRLTRWEFFTAGTPFSVGEIEVTPFSVPHDAADPVAFTFHAQGVKIGLVTDLGYIPELVKQRLRGCHCLIFESNHDLEMLKSGPYPWHVKQRVMSRQGHLSNHATGEFLSGDYDGHAAVLVLAHLSEQNNHPEIARLCATKALHKRASSAELHLANQSSPTIVFRF